MVAKSSTDSNANPPSNQCVGMCMELNIINGSSFRCWKNLPPKPSRETPMAAVESEDSDSGREIKYKYSILIHIKALID